jgi:hypothetical protein
MAKKSTTSPKAPVSKAKAPAAPKTAAPKHRRTTKAKVAEPAPLESAVLVEVAEEAEPVSTVTSSHHPEVNPELEVSKFTITHDDIATLAFSYWERRDYQGGSPEEDWRRAEEELQSLLR